MKQMITKRRIIIACSIAAVVIGIFCLISRFYFDKPQASTAAVVEERKYYIVTTPTGADSLFVYAYNHGDTLLALPTDFVLKAYHSLSSIIVGEPLVVSIMLCHSCC